MCNKTMHKKVHYCEFFQPTVEKGWYSSHPGHSCRDIYDSGDARGDGEYWIDPEKNGNPLKVFCDMSRAGGEYQCWIVMIKRPYIAIMPSKFRHHDKHICCDMPKVFSAGERKCPCLCVRYPEPPDNLGLY